MIRNKCKAKGRFNKPLVLPEQEKFAPIKVGLTVDEMKSGICVPSAVHGYSLAVEYFRDWFISKFRKGYFKTIFINGRHVLQDYMRYSEVSMLKKAKPAVAITPMPHFEHDRDMQDSYIGGKDMLIGKFNHQKSFFKDYENNIYVGLGVRDLEIEFGTKVRVESRAQQIDLLREMEINLRIGYTQYEYISADFHIPLDIIKNIALGAGFELDEKEEVVDVVSFVRYLNAHSEHPIMYKLRTITGKSEYFLRVNKVYTHLSMQNKLDIDDGETEGQLENNFHIEGNFTLNMWIPSYYVISSAKPVYKFIPVMDSSMFGLYTVDIIELPEIDDNGWNLYIKTDVDMTVDDFKNGECSFSIEGLLQNRELKSAILSHRNMLISPTRFLNMRIYDSKQGAEYSIDWDKFMVTVYGSRSMHLVIGIYIDTEYYNEFKETQNNLKKTRYNKEA